MININQITGKRNKMNAQERIKVKIDENRERIANLLQSGRSLDFIYRSIRHLAAENGRLMKRVK